MSNVNVIGQVEGSSLSGSKSVGLTAVRLTTNDNQIRRGILVKQKNTDTGNVFVGFTSDVTPGTVPTTDGFELGGGQSVQIDIDNANKIWLIADTASQTIYWVAL